MLIFFTIVFIISWMIYVFLKLKKPSVIALLFKSITTITLIGMTVYIHSTGINFPGFGYVVIIGLILGLLGDVFLDLKLIFPKENDLFTYFGFYSFLLGHIVYIFYFVSNFDFSMFEVSILFGLAGLIVFLVLMTEKPMQLNYGKFRVISSIYAFALSLITFLSLWVGIKERISGFLIFGIGMISFLISDLILSQSYFGRKEKQWMIYTNYIFYYLAQFLIVISLLYV